MITKRLAILLLVLAVGFGSIFALPKSLPQQPVGVNLELPEFIGEWYGENVQVSQKERLVLGAETEFSRRFYTNGKGDELFVSIVLAGQDMNTGIHRPERCLPAQGYSIVDSTTARIPLSPNALTVTRLHTMRPLYKPNGEQVIALGGRPVNEFSLNYYWFIGCTETTASHNLRTVIDIRDRLFHGYNQRWAYVTVTSRITDTLRKFGRTEEETDAIIQNFITQLAPLIEKPGVVNR